MLMEDEFYLVGSTIESRAIQISQQAARSRGAATWLVEYDEEIREKQQDPRCGRRTAELPMVGWCQLDGIYGTDQSSLWSERRWPLMDCPAETIRYLHLL